ncbi:ATP-binding protein [Jatrophihabitans telluris]|uniref:histidine kinase n=1 Tax=Jatrophihabitans telluris TaxID=2038343 RepID=A0ABY4QVL2_9ACTN|nr:ATP-binding protein [Jatrophihabitans telluris]UQX87605.1 ATP-binding protein [Jatrophihabitans telluris]
MPIRLKIAVASTLATILLLGGAGLIFLTTLRSGLQNSLDSTLRSRADELVAQVDDSGKLRSGTAALHLPASGYGQILGPNGQVGLTTTEQLRIPLVDASRMVSVKGGGTIYDESVQESDPASHRMDVRVLAVPIGKSGYVAAVAISRDVVDEAVERAGKQLLITGAVVLLLAAPGSWLLARQALEPVERMRAQAAALEAQDAEEGLSVPRSRDEIKRLALTFNDLLSRLHQALERERAFVADAGHELRTPLTVLRGELELARRPGRSREDLEETLTVVAAETERLIRLAEDLLVLARDDSSVPLRWHSFDVVAVLAGSIRSLESLADQHAVRIRLVAPDSLMADGDPERLRQAVDNVLNNALRFAPMGSEVTVTAGVAGPLVDVGVADQGPGFAAELLPVVFERFRRGDTARTRSEDGWSSGLGLAIVRSVLRAHRGTAVASNRTDSSGALVRLQWPRRREE